MTTEFKKGDRVLVAKDAAWLNGQVTVGVQSSRGTVQVFDYLDSDGDAVLQNFVAVAPRFLTLVDESSEEKKAVVEITREQRGAWIRVEDAIQRKESPEMEDLDIILSLLPTELTAGPKLPDAPGYYLDVENSVWHLMKSGLFFRVEDGESDARMFGPFKALSVRTEVTADQIRDIVGKGNLMSSEIEQLVALANGRES